MHQKTGTKDKCYTIPGRRGREEGGAEKEIEQDIDGRNE